MKPLLTKLLIIIAVTGWAGFGYRTVRFYARRNEVKLHDYALDTSIR